MQPGHRLAVTVPPPAPDGSGPVESGVQTELEGLTDARPGLAQTVLALARLMDDPRATSQKPTAAKVLASLLDKLHAASAPGRGNLAIVRAMSSATTNLDV